MHKKIIAACVALTMAISFAGCAGNSSLETSLPTESHDSSTATQTTTEGKQEAPAFEHTVLVDNEDLHFSITAITDDSIWGYTLKAQFENKTDKDLMFSLNNVSVNGYMCDPYFALTVTSGMKANKDISFSRDSFQEIGIQAVTDIQFALCAYDSKDWSADAVFQDTFTIYPLGKEAAKEYPRQDQDGDIILFDNEKCTMVVTGAETETVWGYKLNIYLVNKTQDELMFSLSDASINGYMCDPYFATSVAPGKRSITSICWTKSALEENGITAVESLTLPIRVYDAGNWNKEDIVNQSFTINP